MYCMNIPPFAVFPLNFNFNFNFNFNYVINFQLSNFYLFYMGDRWELRREIFLLYFNCISIVFQFYSILSILSYFILSYYCYDYIIFSYITLICH